MEPKPKERIVFDEDLYYGDSSPLMAVSPLGRLKAMTLRR